MTARDTLTGLAKARFDNHLLKTNKALLEYADQVAQHDLLPTRLSDKAKKPKWAKPRKPHGKASARVFTGAEAAELAADKAEKNSRVPGIKPLSESSPESSSKSNDSEVVVPATPPEACRPGSSRRGISRGHHYNLSFEDPETITSRARSYTYSVTAPRK
jgi:hypothetical protein